MSSIYSVKPLSAATPLTIGTYTSPSLCTYQLTSLRVIMCSRSCCTTSLFSVASPSKEAALKSNSSCCVEKKTRMWQNVCICVCVCARAYIRECVCELLFTSMSSLEEECDIWQEREEEEEEWRALAWLSEWMEADLPWEEAWPPSLG